MPKYIYIYIYILQNEIQLWIFLLFHNMFMFLWWKLFDINEKIISIYNIHLINFLCMCVCVCLYVCVVNCVVLPVNSCTLIIIVSLILSLIVRRCWITCLITMFVISAATFIYLLTCYTHYLCMLFRPWM